MSSYATLTLGSLKLGETRNDIDPGLVWLFRPADKRVERIDWRNPEQATIRLTREQGHRGMESRGRAARRGVVDTGLVLAFRDCGLRRSGAAALVWSDIERWDGDALDELRKLRKDYGNAPLHKGSPV